MRISDNTSPGIAGEAIAEPIVIVPPAPIEREHCTVPCDDRSGEDQACAHACAWP